MRNLLRNNLNNNTIQGLLENLKQIEMFLNKAIYESIFGSYDLIRNLVDLQSCIMTVRISEIEKINKIISQFKSCI